MIWHKHPASQAPSNWQAPRGFFMQCATCTTNSWLIAGRPDQGLQSLMWLPTKSLNVFSSFTVHPKTSHKLWTKTCSFFSLKCVLFDYHTPCIHKAQHTLDGKVFMLSTDFQNLIEGSTASSPGHWMYMYTYIIMCTQNWLEYIVSINGWSCLNDKCYLNTNIYTITKEILKKCWWAESASWPFQIAETGSA